MIYISSKAQDLIILASIFVAVSIIVYFVFNKYGFRVHKSKRDAVLLVGILNSGKTALFNSICYEKYWETVTSVKVNDEEVTLNVSTKKRVHLIDLPGHDRLRFLFSDYVPIAKAIVFVIDSSSFIKDSRKAAELLFEVLTNSTFIKNKLPILFACSKMDLPASAVSPDRIRSLLEREINYFKGSKASFGEIHDKPLTEVSAVIGDKENPFKFSDLKSSFKFIQYSIINNQFQSIVEWISVNT